MEYINDPLYQRLNNFIIDDPDAEFSFTDKLCRENNWDFEFGYNAVEEYKKFIYLICVTDDGLTPSQQIDQVWHLHLLYTRSYWEEMCDEIIGRKIHHGPTKGGGEEKSKYGNLYERTIQRYIEVFGKKPNQEFWPSKEQRFKSNKQRWIDVSEYWVIKKIRFFK
ncbi:glycine-rich domain-containing protein [Marinigracilibium pacificum]|uniref:Uncharacterized protein n=1 Tax=Marinigracilibium pacificum TaxID=2729599 RepID=A0A848IW51_9BACT|nr:hypothetical protein [Marinigracilibium pacificum]NMM47505.1 hypothetical protein [Marinigracilibium pacificum]